MTEPFVASSDAAQISLSAELDGDEWVLNGEKWWTSGMGERERWQVAARWVESLKLDRLRETIPALDRHLDATLPVEVRSALPHWIEAALAGDARGLLQLRLIRNLNPRSPQLGDAGLVVKARP